jgi:hypothetical protein
MVIRLWTLFLFAAIPVWAQNNAVAPPHPSSEISNPPPAAIQNPPAGQQIEKLRAECLQHRRAICGKILQVLPDGIVVDTGYTNLMRPPLNRSWLVPGSVKTEPAAHLVEGDQPDCVCVGLLFLTDLPKKPAANVFDYVNLRGYPTGQYTYTSVGDVRRTVRRFSAKLSKAVHWRLEEDERQKAASAVLMR